MAFKSKKKKEIEQETSAKPELQKLKKKELLEIMLAQGEEIDALRAKVAELESKLAKRELDLEEVGTLAEASLKITNIFQEADEAAKIYLENVRRLNDEGETGDADFDAE